MKYQDKVLSNTHEISVILLKDKKWSARVDSKGETLEISPLPSKKVNSLLTESPFLLRLNQYTIINIEHISSFEFKQRENCFQINKETFPIPSRNIVAFRQKYFRQMLSTYCNYNDEKKERFLENQCVSFNDIYLGTMRIDEAKYLLRVGSSTIIYFANKEEKRIYKTLKEVEDILGEQTSFIRVRRNCIVNIRHLTGYSFEIGLKTGSLTIGGELQHISRRQFGVVKKFLKRIF